MEDISVEDMEILLSKLEVLKDINRLQNENDNLKKVSQILINKKVNLNLFYKCWKVEIYNTRCAIGNQLTEEEFDLLKRWMFYGF